jgi:hypothetical protein
MNEKLVENFKSYEDIKEKLKSDMYEGLLLKFGSDRCPPCKALDRGPLEELNTTVNKMLSKKLLVINCNLTTDDLIPLIAETAIVPPSSIPAFFIFKYKDNKLTLCGENVGYDIHSPKEWIKNFAELIMDSLKGK